MFSIVLGFYLVCTPTECGAETWLFEDMNACRTASTLVVDSFHEHNKSRRQDDQVHLLDIQCLEYKKPPAGTLN